MTMDKHVVLPGSERRAPRGTRLDAVNQDEIIEVTVRLASKPKTPDMEAMIKQGKVLTPKEYEETFGCDHSQMQKVEKFAHEFGLTVAGKDVARRSLALRGPIKSMEKAFQVFLANYEHPEGLRFRGRTGAIKIPKDLDGIIEGVFGLDNRPQARAKFRRLSMRSGHLASHKAAPGSFTPLQLAKLYNFPTGVDGKQQCIAIIELGGGYRTEDLKNYFASLGLSDVDVVAKSVDHGANLPSTPDSADGEVMLDIEVAAAVAPKAKIVVYFAPNTDRGFLDAITTAIHDQDYKPSVISISWGSAEERWTKQAMHNFDKAFQSAALLGVSVLAAAGDNGSNDDVNDGIAHVDFPASSPYVLSCGGTKLQADGVKIKKETVWNDGQGGATGGGVSAFFEAPFYQKDNNILPKTVNDNPEGFRGRGVPDISAVADPATGYQILVDGQSMVIGGTSAVAPLLAGLIALVNQKTGKPVGFCHPQLYKDKPTHDITEGDNNTIGSHLGYKAAQGWDGATGLGTPDGAKFLAMCETLVKGRSLVKS